MRPAQERTSFESRHGACASFGGMYQAVRRIATHAVALCAAFAGTEADGVTPARAVVPPRRR